MEKINSHMTCLATKARIRQVMNDTVNFAQGTINVAKFIHQRDHQAIIISGRSSVVSKRLLSAAWNIVYPTTPMPLIINLGEDGNFLLYRGNMLCQQRQLAVQSFIDGKFPALNKLKEENICFLEDCACAGGKYVGLKEIFDLLGFREIDFAFITTSNKVSLNARDFSGHRGETSMVTFAKDVGATNPTMNHTEIFNQIIDTHMRYLAFPIRKAS